MTIPIRREDNLVETALVSLVVLWHCSLRVAGQHEEVCSTGTVCEHEWHDGVVTTVICSNIVVNSEKHQHYACSDLKPVRKPAHC